MLRHSSPDGFEGPADASPASDGHGESVVCAAAVARVTGIIAPPPVQVEQSSSPTPSTIVATPRRRHTADPGSGAYGRAFWLTYANNACLMMAVSLLFRYADFVKLLGGTEWDLGWIVGLGMVGSLLMRMAQGMGIDRYGSRAVWILSVTLFTACCLAHPAVQTVHGPFIYGLRILLATSIAGAFGASITYISRTAPILRVAEVVGTLGTSGFVGMISGTYLGDWLCRGGITDRGGMDRVFMVASGLGAAALVFAILATRGSIPPARRRKPHVLWVVRRYHPGWVLLIGVAMGFGISLPHAFVRPFIHTLGFSGIGGFFLIYSLTAFITRIAIRRLPEKIGIRPMILWGMASLVGSMLLYLLVHEMWQLAAPAVLGGIAHAILFPAVVAGGSGLFPARHRGVGTTLMLASFDLGTLIGAPTIGALLMLSGGEPGHPNYPTMFVCVAGILTVITAVYAFNTWGQRHARS
jgi:MFS family permease